MIRVTSSTVKEPGKEITICKTVTDRLQVGCTFPQVDFSKLLQNRGFHRSNDAQQRTAKVEQI